MSEPVQERVLVYDRIDANRRATRRLLAVFALVLFPVVAYLAMYLMLWVALILGAVAASSGFADIFAGDEGSMIAFVAVDAGISVLILLGAAYIQFRFASALVLRLAGAHPVGPDDEPELRRSVENLCIGAGLPQPRLYVIEAAAPNAFATGMDPRHASLAVTRGALGLLGRRELEGVLAHELTQIANHDTRLATVLAAGVGVLRLPVVIVVGFFRILFRIHWALGWGLLLYLGLPMLAAIPLGISVVDDFLRQDLVAGIAFLALMVLPFYLFLIAPLAAYLIRKVVLRQREFLADADAALLTRHPKGLARALAKMAAAGSRGMKAGAASAHLYVVDPLTAETRWWDRVYSTHPPVEARLALLARMGSGVVPPIARPGLEAGAGSRDADPPGGAPSDEWGSGQVGGVIAVGTVVFLLAWLLDRAVSGGALAWLPCTNVVGGC